MPTASITSSGGVAPPAPPPPSLLLSRFCTNTQPPSTVARKIAVRARRVTIKGFVGRMVGSPKGGGSIPIEKASRRRRLSASAARREGARASEPASGSVQAR
jgi:hypothetical protein